VPANSFWSLQGPEGGLAGVWRRARQLAAGAIETTVANSATAGDRNSGIALGGLGYRPAIIDQPGALIGVIQSLAGHTPKSGSYTANALARSRIASVRTNRTLGITDPRDTAETALRVGGSFLIPGPKTGVVAKAAEGAGYLEKALRGTARVATEIALPLRQTGLKGAAVGTGVGTGIVEAVHHAIGTPGYKGIGDDTSNEELDFDRSLAESPKTEEQRLNSESLGTDESTFDSEVNAALDGQEDANTHSRLEQGAAIAGTLLGGYAVARALRGQGTKALENATEDAAMRFTGKQFLRSRSSRVNRVITAVAQGDKPIRDIVQETLSPDRAAKYGYKLDLVNNVSIGARLRDQFLTGRLVGSNGRTVKLAPIADAWAKELTPEEQTQVSDALLAASALDDFRNNGKLASLNLTRTGAPTTPAELDNLVQSVRGNPKLAKYFDNVQQSYRDKLKYELRRGMIDQATYTEMLNKRPNYVEMTRNLEPDANPLSQERHQFSANEVSGASRSTDELGGVQGTTGIANPFHSLFGSWADTVRRAELNDLRASVLSEVAANSPLNADGKAIVKQLPHGQKPYKMENVHQVFVNGKVVNYRVIDPMLNKALHFAPRASAQGLEQMRQFSQGLTTGPIATLFNQFAILKSPIYDTIMGTLLRPRGMAPPGIINEALGTKLPDPTSALGAYTGAVRYMWDDMRGKMATNVASQMFRENSWLRDLIGDTNVGHLQSMLERGYEGSIKAELDRIGAASHTLHGSPDSSKVATGVEDIAPSFSRSALSAENRDIADAALKGDISPFKALLMRGRNTFAKARSNQLAATYQGVMEAMHNGFRYQALATNKSRIKDLDQLGSQLRRLSADAAQHGSSDPINKTFGSFMYANLGVQSLYEFGKMMKNDQTRALTNLGATILPLLALHYGGLATDPEALAKHQQKTPHQKLVSMTTFGGAEIPLDPVVRLFMSFMLPVLDHVTGAADGKWNPDVINTMDNWLHGSISQDDKERLAKDQEVMLWDAVKQNNPLDPTAIPGVSAAEAFMGVDPGMSRITGEPALVRPQQVTGLDPDASSPDGIGTAYAENMISSLFSSTGRALYQMSDDMYRAYGKGGLEDGVRVAASRYKDNTVTSGALTKPIYGGYETVKGLADTNFELMRDRKKGIDTALQVYRKDQTFNTITGRDAKYSDRLPTEEGVQRPQLQGTELAAIVNAADSLNKLYLGKYQQHLSDLAEENEFVRNQYLTKIEQRNHSQNAINAERKHINFMMLQATRRYEEQISKQIGRPFRFDDFDPKDYMKPLEASQPQ
jgi:hypothetical protein